MASIIVCKPAGEKRLCDCDLNDSVPIAKDMVRKALADGIENPKAHIYARNERPAWLIISKKDIASPITSAQKLTPQELAVLKRILAMYESHGVDNTSFDTLLNSDDDVRKMKGIVGSLVRKQVVSKSDCPECFNPLYPSNSFAETCRAYGLEIHQGVKYYL